MRTCLSWVHQSRGVLGAFKSPPKWTQGSEPLQTLVVWNLALYLKVLFSEQIQSCSKAFLFNKLIYKSPLYASTFGTYLYFLISTWLACSVFPVSALFCRGMSEKVNFVSVHYSLPWDEETKGIKLDVGKLSK